jgi:ABC-type enterobactin transport system permease subunit
MALFVFIAKAAIAGSLAGSIRFLVANDPNIGRALRFEIPPWA